MQLAQASPLRAPSSKRYRATNPCLWVAVFSFFFLFFSFYFRLPQVFAAPSWCFYCVFSLRHPTPSFHLSTAADLYLRPHERTSLASHRPVVVVVITAIVVVVVAASTVADGHGGVVVIVTALVGPLSFHSDTPLSLSFCCNSQMPARTTAVPLD